MSSLSPEQINKVQPIFSRKANKVGEDWWSSKEKRLLEKTIAGCIIGTPPSPYLGILLLAMGVNYVVEGKPIFYKNKLRHPYYGDVSHLKLRTMIPGREEDENTIIQEHGQLHVRDWDDPRVTKTGRLLRQHSIDELPQILTSVFLGEENMVGFRIPGENEYANIVYPNEQCEPYRTYLENQRRGLRSGVTSLAAVVARDTPFETRLHYDNYWAEHCTIWSDLTLIAMTAKVPILQNGR